MTSGDMTARMYFDQGRQSYAQQDYDQAADHFKLAIQQDPMYNEAHRYLAESYLKLGYRHRAKKALEQLLKITHEDKQVLEIKQKLDEL